ncbi:MAG: hybrid sensor histidine kinase/response regulator [Proteobacteria bacterium]|nr:hybrid sensor histidine kinase/response regulator [Pseudomonadota bacterium]
MEKYHILIVDDVVSNLKLLEKILRQNNHKVSKALSGKEAIELASRHKFTLALIDIVMPEMDGMETARRIKTIELNNNLPVIFLSAIMKEQQDIMKGFEFGAFDYILKPYDSVLLLNKVRVFCDLWDQKKLLSEKNEELQTNNSALEEAITKSKIIQQELNASQKELRKHQEHLEELIEERTKALIKARQEAEEANRAKSEFLASISHELRTPLHQIQGYTKMGIDRIYKENREKLLEFFQEAYSSSQRMGVLQNNLLDLSRLEATEVVFDFQDLNLSELIREIVEEYSKKAAEENIEVRLDFRQKTDLIAVDQSKFKQVLRNLLNNAFDFSEFGSSITIQIEEKKNDFQISMIDLGIGIPEQELISVFDKFGKSSNTRDLSSGAGLGLFVSNMIITGHKGRIWAEINPDGGTIIKVVVPKDQKRRRKLLGQILVENGYITKEQLTKELKKQHVED